MDPPPAPARDHNITLSDDDRLPPSSLEDGKPLYTPRDQVRPGYMGAVTRTPTPPRPEANKHANFLTWLGRYPRSWE